MYYEISLSKYAGYIEKKNKNNMKRTADVYCVAKKLIEFARHITKMFKGEISNVLDIKLNLLWTNRRFFFLFLWKLCTLFIVSVYIY
jgi:hypothetical protein